MSYALVVESMKCTCVHSFVGGNSVVGSAVGGAISGGIVDALWDGGIGFTVK